MWRVSRIGLGHMSAFYDDEVEDERLVGSARHRRDDLARWATGTRTWVASGADAPPGVSRREAGRPSLPGGQPRAT